MEPESKVKVFVAGSNNSALERAVEPLKPPATSTSPFWSSVMLNAERPERMLPTAVKEWVTGL